MAAYRMPMHVSVRDLPLVVALIKVDHQQGEKVEIPLKDQVITVNDTLTITMLG